MEPPGPPVPGWATLDSMRRRVAEADDQERQEELRKQAAELQATMVSMQQQQVETDSKIMQWSQTAAYQVPETHRAEVETLISGEDSKVLSADGADRTMMPRRPC